MDFITGIGKIVIEIILTEAEIKEHYSLTGKKNPYLFQVPMSRSVWSFLSVCEFA